MPAAVYLNAMHLISPAGDGVNRLWDRIAAKQTCLELHHQATLAAKPFFGALLAPAQWDVIRTQSPREDFTPFEQLAYASARAALDQYELDKSKTLFLLATTKGNIAGLGQMPDERMALHRSAGMIGTALGIPQSITISQACISGLSAILYGSRQLLNNRYEHVVVTGADLVSRFVLSGFQSFHAVAAAPCRPFDAARSGINLGEAAATVILSRQPQGAIVRLAGGAITNDANHISGPSRTGAELAMAITNALREAGIGPEQIDALSAHGTATLYNDDMESKAFARAGLLHAPLHSAKGATGHTLGAAGVLESVLVAGCLQRQAMLPSLGFEQPGVPEPVTVCTAIQKMPMRYMLKTASGFGGCNAALVWAGML